jgi:hypothetical protein
MAARDLANDEIVNCRLIGIQHRDEGRIAASQVIDPNRRIYEDHAGRERRRPGVRNWASVPPNRARRRALSL